MTNKIVKQQIKLYEKANYDFKKDKWVLKEKNMNKLHRHVIDYVDDIVSYSDNEERSELIERLTYSLLDEVINGLNREF